MRKRIYKTIEQKIEEAQNFEVNTQQGLSKEQVEIRKKEGLWNSVPKKVTKSYAAIIFGNLFNYFNILLVLIAILLGIAELYSSMVFLFILCINVGIGMFQDIKARVLISKLSLLTAQKVTVIRGGEKKVINFDEVALSDILILSSGCQIPSDCIIREGRITVNESFLTGESVPCKKEVDDFVFGVSYVTSGEALVQVVKVGKANYAESIQNQANKFSRPKSEIIKSYGTLFNVLGIIVTVIAILQIITLSFGGNLFDYEYYVSVVGNFAGSLVAMIPIGMYLLTSITLAVGVVVLSKKRMLVHELYCIEMLARIDVLCLDKTGTLTDGTMVVEEIVPFEKNTKEEIIEYVKGVIVGTKDMNLTAKGLIKQFGNETNLIAKKTIPFDSDKKMSAVTFTQGDTIIMGANNFFDYVNKDEIQEDIKKYEMMGRRVLLIGKTNSEIKDDNVTGKITVIGLVISKENIKENAIKIIEWFKNNGVEIKVISGDSAVSVSQIAQQVGIEGYDKTISLAGVSLQETETIADSYNVFGRVTPEQKETLIGALQKLGKKVAMTGDGVNDILALKKADCSIAMASGADAAKTISHLVSTDSDFSSFPDVVGEGRRVINNIQRASSLFLVKTIFAIIISCVFMFAGWINSEIKYPFITNSLYIWELITIGLGSFFLAIQPNRNKVEGSLMANILNYSVPAGVLMAFAVISMFVANTINPAIFTYNAVVGMSVIMFTIISFVVFCLICFPFDKYRGILTGIIFVLVVGFFALDVTLYYSNIDMFFFGSGSILKIEYQAIVDSVETIIMGSITTVITSILLIFITYMVKKSYSRRIKAIKGEQDEN